MNLLARLTSHYNKKCTKNEISAPITIDTNKSGKAHRELPRQEVIIKGNVKAPDITIPFHHHCAQGKLKCMII